MSKVHYEASGANFPGVAYVPYYLLLAHPNYRDVLEANVDACAFLITDAIEEGFEIPESILDGLSDALELAKGGHLIALRNKMKAIHNGIESQELAFSFGVVVDGLYREIDKQDFNRRKNIGKKMMEISEAALAKRIEAQAFCGAIDKNAVVAPLRKVG